MGDTAQNVAEKAGDKLQERKKNIRDATTNKLNDPSLSMYLPATIDPTTIPTFLENKRITLPADDYVPRPFDGPKSRSQRFHSVPRGGNTNDIVALTRWERAGHEEETAREYVRGIVVVSVVMALVYVVWGVLLLLLRAGRIREGRCCYRFRMCCGGPTCGWLSGRAPKRPTRESLIRDAKLKKEKSAGTTTASSDVTCSQEKVTQTACSATAISKKKEEGDTTFTTILNPKGEDSAARTFLVEICEDGEGSECDECVEVSFSSRSAVDPSVRTFVLVESNADIDNDTAAANTATNIEDKGEDDARCTVGREEPESSTDDQVFCISDEYLAKRRRRQERSMIAIRTSFLFSGAVVLVACLSLCLVGFRAIDNIIEGTAKVSLEALDNYFEDVVEECDQFINRTDEARASRETFFALMGESQQINGNNATGARLDASTWDGGSQGLCPNAPSNGYIKIDVNLGTLFEGPLLKLAEANDEITGEDKITVVNLLNGTKLGGVLNFDFQGLKALVEKLASTDKRVLTTRWLQNETILSAAGTLGNITIIGNATAYKERDLSAILAANYSFSLDLYELVDRIHATIEDYPPFLRKSILTLRNGTQMLQKGAKNLDEDMENARTYWYIAVTFAAFLMLLVVLLMSSCILAWASKQPRIFSRINSRFALPIFIFIGMLVWIFTCVFLCLAILSGDLCVNNPDIQVDRILASILEPRSAIAYNFARYYLHGCLPEEKPMILDLIVLALHEMRKAGADFFNLVSTLGAGPLGKACGTDFNAFRAAGYLLSVRLEASLDVLFDLSNILLCRSFHPLYSLLMYNAFCTDTINLLGPMFTSLCLMAIFSMIMVTLRVATHESEDDIVEGNGEEELDVDF